MISVFFSRHKIKILGVLGGAIGGYLYYYFIGCKNGSCMIASNPWVSVPYFALLGYLLTGIFRK